MNIFSMEWGEIWVHKNSLTPQSFIKVSVQSHESERSCICVLCVSILHLFYDCDIWFWNCSDNEEYFVFHYVVKYIIYNTWVEGRFNCSVSLYVWVDWPSKLKLSFQNPEKSQALLAWNSPFFIYFLFAYLFF